MIGLILVNLGTPEAPTTRAVRRYLREFLSDPRVIDINPLARWMLVNFIIAPFRSPKTAAAYQKIWTEQGSPLLTNTLALSQKVQENLGSEYKVKVAMRYGNPKISEAIDSLNKLGAKEIRILPLYPQYASSSTGSTEEAVLKITRNRQDLPEVKFLPPFFDHPGFLETFTQIGRPLLETFKPDHILFSFHGLPERHILEGDLGGKHCLKRPDCCEKIVPANGMCYRAHCVQSARGIAKHLGLNLGDYSITFQSRLGRTPWIQPFTDFVLKELGMRKTPKVAVFCPSFVADCLETLEEIGIRAQESFREDGGQELLLIPSLNDHPHWAQCVSNMVRG